MNICFLIYNISNSAGSERVTSMIANELSKDSHNVSILSLCGNNKCFYDLESNIKVKTLYENVSNINYKTKYLAILNKVYQFYKENKIEIVIDVYANMSMFTIPIKKLLQIKNISWEHSNFYSDSDDGKVKMSRKLACKYSNALITLTKEDIETYKKNLQEVNCYIDYIYNPTPFPNVEHSKLNTNNIITVGRLTYQKGYDMLLKAWKKVIMKNKEWNLIILGRGEEEQNLKRQKQELELENVSFEGVSNNIQKYYKEASIFVSSSRCEGLPMCMIEAKSFGIPIVAFDCKTGPSEIIENGENGFLVENGNVDELAEKLLFLMENRNKILEFSSKSNIEKFDIKVIMKKWNDIINKI